MSGPLIAALGIDAGSATTKVVGVSQDGELTWSLLEPTDPQLSAQAQQMVSEAMAAASSPADGLPLVATGCGRDLVSRALDAANPSARRVTEITCHARGVFRRTRQAGTLIDIGGQDSKVILIGANGDVVSFAMNDKCAAGTGRYLEIAAARLRLSLEELAEVALASDGEVAISSTCTVFAESEMVSLIAQGQPVPHIVRGLHRSLVRRVVALTRSAGLTAPVMLSGGGARSSAAHRLLAEELHTEVLIPEQPQLMGAYGAALLALKRPPAGCPPPTALLSNRSAL